MDDKPEYLQIHDWDDHQADRGDMTWIKCYTKLLHLPKFFNLTSAQRGVLFCLWLYRGATGLNPPADPQCLRSVLRVPRDRYVSDTVETLIRRGFLKKVQVQRRVDKRRGEEKGNGAPRSRRVPAPPPPSGKPFPEPDPMSDEEKEATIALLWRAHRESGPN
jgi:hypothetical protein